MNGKNISRKEFEHLLSEIYKKIKAGEWRNEYHTVLYSDNVWEISFTCHRYGTTSFFIAYEYANGRCNGSPATVYGIEADGTLRYGCDLRLTKAVEKRLKGYYESLVSVFGQDR